MNLDYVPRPAGGYSAEEISRLVELGVEHHWVQNHVAQDITASGAFRIMVEGDGLHIIDIEGNRYIDAMAGLFVSSLGHGRSEIIDAVTAQISQLEYANSGAYSTVPAILLSSRLAAVSPGDLSRVFFCGGGSEAVEIALKMAKQYHFENGNPNKTKVISRRGQYHGSTYAAMSLGFRGKYKGAFDPMMPGAVQIDPPDWYRAPTGSDRDNLGEEAAAALERLVDAEGAGTIATFIGSPTSGAKMIPPDDYWPRIREICTKNDILLIADEVTSGFGRLGRWFAMEHWNVVPDIMTVAKALTAGYVPVGAVVATKTVGDRFRGEGKDTFMHGVTYGSHPGVMAAGLATLDIMERAGVVENSAEMGGYLYKAIIGLADEHPSIGFIGGGLGLLLNIDMVKNRATKEPYDKSEPEYTTIFTQRLRDRGLATRGGDKVTLAPPLTIDAGTIDEIVQILDLTISEMEKDYAVNEPFNEPVSLMPYVDADWWQS